MKRTASYERLTNPTLSPNRDFRSMSYALFRTDEDFGRVIGTRFPVGSLLSVGNMMQSRLRLSDEALAYLLRWGDRETPLFCLSDAGLGMLCKRYDAAFGVGLYLHIHCRPDAGARLLCAGALGSPDGMAFGITSRIRMCGDPPDAEDARSFAPLLDAWRAVQTGMEGIIGQTDGESHRVARTQELIHPTLGELEHAVERMAAFVGCRVDCTVSDRSRRVACYRPLAAETLLLCLLTEIRTHAVTRRASVHLTAVEDSRGSYERRLCMSASYSVDTLHMSGETRTRLSEIRQYITNMAEISGLEVSFPSLLLPDLRASRRDYLSRQTVTLEWLTDPTRLPSSDFKARLGFDLREDDRFP